MNASTAFGLVKTIQSNSSGRRRRASQRVGIVWRHDLDHRRLDRLGAERGKTFDELRCLFARTCHEHAPAEERPRVEPSEVLAKSDDAADDEDGRLAARVLAHEVHELGQRSRQGSSASIKVPL